MQVTRAREFGKGNAPDNVDVNIVKKFKLTERVNVQFACQAFNVLNHPQFTPGFPDSVFSVAYTSSRSVLEPQNPQFHQDQNYFPSHARTLQLV